jgi:excinuclease UvrABC nuclease subunit
VDEAAYGRQVDAFLAFLDGRDGSVLAALAARRERLAGALRFEAAAGVQRDLDLLEEVRRRRRTLAWVVTRQNFVVLLPTVARDAAHFYAVLGGRLVHEARITATADLAVAVAFVRRRFASCQDVPLRREEVDGTTILAAWLRDRQARDGILLPLDGPDAIVERLDELAVTVRDLRLPGPLPPIDGLA